MSEELMNDNQVLDLARMGRGKMTRKIYEENIDTIDKVFDAFRDGRTVTIGPMPTELQYPEWVIERLTSELEVSKVTDPGEIELWFHPLQISRLGDAPTGSYIYEAHSEDYLKKALSLGHLKFFKKNPDQIPSECKERGLYICAWASVVRDANGNRRVPCLRCLVGQSYVYWYYLASRWRSDEPSGLLAS